MNSLSWDNHNLLFSNVSIMDMVQKYQTPLFVYDQDQIEKNIFEIKDVCHQFGDMSIYYASKAFLTLAMAKIIKDNHVGIDVASRGELFIALKGGIDPKNILYHGNNKSSEDIYYALDQGVRKFVIDSIQELSLMDKISLERNIGLDILIRVIPKVEGINTHKNITTGHHRSKFGIDMDLYLEQAATLFIQAKYLHFKGLHFHIGSQLFTNEYHLNALDHVFVYIKTLKESYHLMAQELNIGGGFGIRYKEDDQPMSIQAFLNPIMHKIQRLAQNISIPVPHVSIEPGRYIVGGTAIILYTVGIIKQGIPHPLAAINGGMTENLRVALYDATYQAMLVNRHDVPKEVYTIVGQACESTDLMIEHALLPRLITGDTIAFMNAGAYEHSLVNNFNKTLRPTVIMIHQGKDRIIQRREEFEELVKRDQF